MRLYNCHRGSGGNGEASEDGDHQGRSSREDKHHGEADRTWHHSGAEDPCALGGHSIEENHWRSDSGAETWNAWNLLWL